MKFSLNQMYLQFHIIKKMQKQNNLRTQITHLKKQADKKDIIQQKIWTFKLSNQNIQHRMYKLASTPFSIYPVYGNSFLIKDNFKSKVHHILHDGTHLKQRNLEGGNIFLMTDKKAVVWSHSKKQQKYYITQWDLQSNQIVKLSYQNLLKGQKYSPSLEVLAFSESKLFCIVEKTHRGEKMSITYYQFPLISDKDKPVYQHVFELKLKLGHEYQFGKINNHSGLIWRNIHMDTKNSEFHFFTFDLRFSKQLEEHKFDHGIKLKLMYKIQIFDVWQLSQQQIYVKLKVKADKSQFTDKYRRTKITQRRKAASQLFRQEKYYQFIWNIRDKSYHTPKYLQSTTFKLNKQYHIQFINNLRPIKILQLDNSEYIRLDQFTLFNQIQKPRQLQHLHYRLQNIYFVDPQSESVVAFQKFSKNHHASQFSCYFSDANSNVYYEYYMDWDKNQIQFQVKQLRVNFLLQNRQTYFAFLVLGFFKGNCDEDLINYVINLVQDKDITEYEKIEVQKKNQYI